MRNRKFSLCHISRTDPFLALSVLLFGVAAVRRQLGIRFTPPPPHTTTAREPNQSDANAGHPLKRFLKISSSPTASYPYDQSTAIWLQITTARRSKRQKCCDARSGRSTMLIWSVTSNGRPLHGITGAVEIQSPDSRVGAKLLLLAIMLRNNFSLISTPIHAVLAVKQRRKAEY